MRSLIHCFSRRADLHPAGEGQGPLGAGVTDGATDAVDCLNFPDMNGPFPSQIEWAYLSHFKSAAVILYDNQVELLQYKLTHLIC